MTKFNLVKTLTRREQFSFYLLRMKMFAWFYFAHHPLCKNYRQEVIEIKGMYLCKGCTEVYSSSFFVIFLVAIFNPLSSLNLFQLLIIAFLSIIPAIIGNIIHFKRRVIKDIIRIILGVGIGIGLSELLLFSDLVTKVVIIIIFLLIYYLFKFTRSKKNIIYHDDLCSNCKQFTEQACESYKRVFVTEREYSRVISDFIQKRLSVNQIQSMGFKNFMQDDD